MGLAKQTDDLLTAVAVDMSVRFFKTFAWVDGVGAWHWPVPVGAALLEPGAGIALAKQTDDTLTAATASPNGTLHIAWTDGVGDWQGPVPVGGPVLDRRSGIALAHQIEETLTAAAISPNGTLHIAWTDGVGDWQGPVPVGAALLEPGAGIALAKQTDDTLTAATASPNGTLHIAWTDGVGDWQGPVPVGGPVLDPRSGIALAHQIEETLTAAAISPNGTLHVAWTDGVGDWQGPVPVGGPVLDPRSGIALAHQIEETLTAAAISPNGTLHVAWTDGVGDWQGPVPVGGPVLDPRSGIALAHQIEETFTCIAVGQNGIAHVAWVDGTGRWQGPVPMHGPSRRICQLTGNRDPDGLPHINDSTTVGIGGTDLGFPVQHGDSLVFLFGDQFGLPDQIDMDPIGVSGASGADIDGFPLSYVTEGGRFRPFQVTQLSPLKNFETPTGGFSHAGRLWAFLNKKVEGTPNTQTLLASADDQRHDFQLHYSLTYVANQGGPPPPPGLAGHHLLSLAGSRVVNSADWPQLKSQAAECLLICGQAFGPERAHLAYVDLPLDTPHVASQHDATQLKVKYFAGLESNGLPRWDDDPTLAQQLFELHKAVTFVSYSWVPGLNRWLAMYTEARPFDEHWNPDHDPGEPPWRRPIVVRSAPAPWGPWSERMPLVYPAEAYANHWLTDPAREGLGPGGIGGWLYCPALVERFTRWDPETHTATIHYLVSAGDPYHVHLMRAALRPPA